MNNIVEFNHTCDKWEYSITAQEKSSQNVIRRLCNVCLALMSPVYELHIWIH